MKLGLNYKFGVDTSENEPSKIGLPTYLVFPSLPGSKNKTTTYVDSPSLAISSPSFFSLGARSPGMQTSNAEKPRVRHFADDVRQTLQGSFSAGSKRNFARKYAFESIFQAPQDLHPFAPLQSQNFSKTSVWKINNFRENSSTSCKCCNICKILPNFKNFS